MHYKCNNLIYSSLHHLLHVHVYFSLVLKNRSSVFPTRLDTNRAEQPQKMARGLRFRILKVEGLYYSYLAKTKALISCAVTAQLLCVFVFAYKKPVFSLRVSYLSFHVSSMCFI